MHSKPFAIYRLPYANEATLITQTEGEPEEYLSCVELNGKSGFVIAPFQTTPEQPILLIRPDHTESLSLPPHPSSPLSHSSFVTPHSSFITSSYSVDFSNFLSQLKSGCFQKIVLSRCADERMPEGIDAMQLFYRACAMYPRLFIALVDTEKSGCWLTATPEILLDGKGHDWRTIALAGTMKLEGEQLSFDSPPCEGGAGVVGNFSWSPKNLQEQRIVSTYITECLEQFTADFREEGPRTVRAANLVHLRSDFTFRLSDNDHIGNLLQALHPTPAVCGLPKREAFQFIIYNEYTPRRYYSGFMGPLSQEETHLYVSLRCMNIEGSTCHLYAGGGLLKDSTLDQEWLETEAKLLTMRQILT